MALKAAWLIAMRIIETTRLPFRAAVERRPSLPDDAPNFHKTYKIGGDGMKYSTKIRKEASALIEIMPCLSPDCVHYEISNFQRWFTHRLRHEVTLGRNAF
jgi:hypothetical protein